MRITAAILLEAAHRLPEHPRGCRNVHGHSYLIEATVQGSVDSLTGMVLDIGDLRAALRKVAHEPWDHAYLAAPGDPVADALEDLGLRVVRLSGPPTAELMANLVLRELALLGLPVVSVRVRETEHGWATAGIE